MQGLFLEGLFLQASLIFALGAQNLFVLESAMKKQHPMAISFVCFLCDFTLITIGVAGAGSLFSSFTYLKIIIGLVGIFFLAQYGFSKIFRTQETMTESKSVINPTLKKSILLAITFSVLNPHAYLDAFILIGGYSSKYEMLSDRLMVGFGAAFFSLIWFLMLSSASSIMKPLFCNTKSLRFVATCTGLVLLFLSFRLSQDVYGWILEAPPTQLHHVKVVNHTIPLGLTYSSITY